MQTLFILYVDNQTNVTPAIIFPPLELLLCLFFFFTTTFHPPPLLQRWKSVRWV